MKISCAELAAGADPVAGRFREPDLDHLPRIVPLVDGSGGVETLVALEPHEVPRKPRGEHLGDLGLADARLALEEERPLQLQREEDGGGEPAVGDVVLRGEEIERRVDGGGDSSAGVMRTKGAADDPATRKDSNSSAVAAINRRRPPRATP